MNASSLKISNEVELGLRQGLPIVALESTIITHGLPHPVNVETAISVEECIRHMGCVPATIAIVDGEIRIGLSTDEIAFLGRLERRNIIKVSRADLPYVISKRLMGSTTVAATMICAQLAGISVFATGGIGGVHRGGESSMDVSADIYEFGRTDVTVVCAGAKSILDIGRTLELLESQGVPVVGFQTRNFPAFYYRDSGFPLSIKLDTPAEVAELIHAKRRLGLTGGIVIANPIPEADAMSRDEAEGYIEKAAEEARVKNITGKGVTPFLLERIAILSKERSLSCNVALIKNNARIAAEIAKEHCKAR